jgi:hypothetical protein
VRRRGKRREEKRREEKRREESERYRRRGRHNIRLNSF